MIVTKLLWMPEGAAELLLSLCGLEHKTAAANSAIFLLPPKAYNHKPQDWSRCLLSFCGHLSSNDRLPGAMLDSCLSNSDMHLKYSS